jgi:hypothetical protein
MGYEVEKGLFFIEEIPSEDVRDDIDDYLDYIAYMVEQAKEEGMDNKLFHGMPDLDKKDPFILAMISNDM